MFWNEIGDSSYGEPPIDGWQNQPSESITTLVGV